VSAMAQRYKTKTSGVSESVEWLRRQVHRHTGHARQIFHGGDIHTLARPPITGPITGTVLGQDHRDGLWHTMVAAAEPRLRRFVTQL